MILKDFASREGRSAAKTRDDGMAKEKNLDIITKPWGRYEIVAKEEKRVVKLLHVDPNQALSLQSHDQRGEHWTVLEGVANVELDGETRILQAHDTINIPKGAKHRLANYQSQPLVVLEVQYGEVISEADIVRYKDRYGRPTDEYPGSRAGRAITPRTARQWRVPTHLVPPVVICEIGCNHKAELDIALEMIAIAAQFCKADVVKFQKRCNKELLTPVEYNAPHPNPFHSYGETYGQHREYLEFDVKQHEVLKMACEEWGVTYSTSVWDLVSAREIARLEPAQIKIPSAINTNLKVVDYLCEHFGGEIHISLGMTLRREEDELVELIDRHGRLKDTVLYHCVSSYPVDEEDLYLFEIGRLKQRFDGAVKGIGFSGHHRGIAADIAALTLGADYFERHFTLDRTWKGTDHAASLEPDGFRRMARDLRNVKEALTYKKEEIAEVEAFQRKKLKKFAKLAS